MDLSKHFVLLNGEPKTLQIDTIQKVSSKQNDEHLRRSTRMLNNKHKHQK